MKRFVLPVGFLIMSIIYIIMIPTENTWIQVSFKIIPMLILILYVYTSKVTNDNGYKKFILIGLIFCTVGDASIGFSFVFGLAAFLVGHMFYIPAFIKRHNYSWNQSVIQVLLVIYASIIGYFVVSALIDDGKNGLIIPVILYIITIATMGSTAVMTRNSKAIIGSILFIISDSILSWNMFVSTIAYSGELIMTTYYAAQFLIASSVIMKSKLAISNWQDRKHI